MASNVGSAKNLLVGAIDFGTTYSGWAYSFYHDFKIDPRKGYIKQWVAGSGALMTEKTPTVVLIKPDGKTLEAFGYEAEDRYRDLIDTGEYQRYFYFRNFKMLLHKKLSEKLDRTIMLEDEIGKPLLALDVFALSIQYLVEDMQKTIKLRVTESIERSDVHWVLTVPAIWTDSAKQFMRESAEKAGIERNKLSIALEPEAASIYCMYLPVDTATCQENVSISSLPIGTRYMVLDAGGGTIDITIHEIIESRRIKEVAAASGGGWGGTLVDQAFEDLLEDLVGRDVFHKFKAEQTEDWLDLIREFEVKKKTINPEKEGNVRMKFPISLSEMSEKTNRQTLSDFIQDSSDYCEQIEFEKDKIKFNTNVFKQLFTKPNKNILQHVEYLMRKNYMSASVVLMVGGYSESPMLQRAVQKAFPTMQIVVPSEASTAILRGALICGHSSDLISERVLKYTYGVETVENFMEGVHPESKRFKAGNVDYCDNVFNIHVQKGQVVRIGEAQASVTYVPLYKNQKSMRLNIFATELEDPHFIDICCTKIGTMKVVIDAEDLEGEVEVFLTFSGTEIKVDAKVKKTGHKTNVVVDFLG